MLRPTAFCAGCGAPLLLGEERPPSPLDAPLDLNRRSRGPVESELTPAGVAPRAAPRCPAACPGAIRPRAGARAGGRALRGARRARALALGPRPGPCPGGADDLPRRRAPAADGAATRARDGRARPTTPSPTAEVDALEVHVAARETWRRVAAWAFDGLPFVAAGVALAGGSSREAAAALAPPAGVDGLLDLLARERVIALSVTAAVTLALAVYATLAHALGGATLGKRLLRIRVVGPDGAPPLPPGARSARCSRSCPRRSSASASCSRSSRARGVRSTTSWHGPGSLRLLDPRAGGP